jgi:hypothetical protein
MGMGRGGMPGGGRGVGEEKPGAFMNFCLPGER